MSYTFNKVKKVGKWEVSIDEESMYGYFEHDDFGEGGGIWFEKNADGVLEVSDFDGVFQLPNDVISVIRELGFVVEDNE
jgi:hypothetical protein